VASARRTPRRRTGESSGLLQQRCVHAADREAEVSAEAPRGRTRGLRERSMTAHPAGMPPLASLKRPSHVRVADWACVVQLRARGARRFHRGNGRGRKRRLVIASVVHAIRRRAALEAAPISPLQRSHLRATPDGRRSDDASRKPSWSTARVPIRNTMPLLLSIAIIVLAGLAASVPELQSEPMSSLSSGFRTDLPSPRLR